MSHIHTESGQHDHAATAFIVRTDTDEPQILFHMHRKFGVLMPPGGHVELNESPWASLAHELEEEAGYHINELAVWQPKRRLKEAGQLVMHPQPIFSNTYAIGDAHFHTDLDYLLIATAPPSGLPAEGESQDLRWLTRAEIVALGSDLMIDSTRAVCLYALDELLSAPEYEAVPATDFQIGGSLGGLLSVGRLGFF